MMGGLTNHKLPLIEGTPEEFRQEVRRVMAEAGETGFILGTDCTIPTGTSYDRLRTAVDALEGL